MPGVQRTNCLGFLASICWNGPYASGKTGFRIIEPLAVKGFPTGEAALPGNLEGVLGAVRRIGERLPNLKSVAAVRYEINPFAIARPARDEVPPRSRCDLTPLPVLH